MRGLAESYPFVWTNLTLDFRVAFKALCQSSTNLTTLYLENMAGVPHTLLTGTHIKHLRFHLIHLARSNTAFIPFPEDHFPKGQLESIDIDYSFPFPFPTQDLIEKDIHHRESVSHRQPLFSHVKRLKYILRPCDDLQKFVVVARGISSSLEVVYLQLSGTDLKASSPEIPFEELHNLRCMIIRHKSVVCALTRHPLIKVATILRNLASRRLLTALRLLSRFSRNRPGSS
ncbi:hypothetical protein BDZ97DRAFT_1921659 [Flammula alnicola]|nr:hypothetical protein BDZ97DRAFT_1921659 [Flammula alnicola]